MEHIFRNNNNNNQLFATSNSLHAPVTRILQNILQRRVKGYCKIELFCFIKPHQFDLDDQVDKLQAFESLSQVTTEIPARWNSFPVHQRQPYCFIFTSKQNDGKSDTPNSKTGKETAR